MTREIVNRTETEFTAATKAARIAEALDLLRGAHAIDERETLGAEEWVAWYDATIPAVVDIKDLAGAMEIELGIRRGERLLAAGDERGGDRKSAAAQIKVEQCTTLIQSEKDMRTGDRLLARHAPAVRQYVQHSVARGRRPTRRGALRIARAAAPPVDHRRRGFQSTRARVAGRVGRVRALLEELDGEARHSDRELARAARRAKVDLEKVLWACRLIPWLDVDRDESGTRIRIDRELQALCDGRRSRPELQGWSLKTFLSNLRTEIVRRRKENNDARIGKNWNHEGILRREQSNLLDWIEKELTRIP